MKKYNISESVIVREHAYMDLIPITLAANILV
jgi:hypothetical protein